MGKCYLHTERQPGVMVWNESNPSSAPFCTGPRAASAGCPSVSSSSHSRNLSALASWGLSE